MITIDLVKYQYHIRQNGTWRQATPQEIQAHCILANPDDDYILKLQRNTTSVFKMLISPDWNAVPISEADLVMSGDGDWAIIRIPTTFIEDEDNCFESIPGNCGRAEIFFGIPAEFYDNNDELIQIF